jgi:hypothetical protein
MIDGTNTRTARNKKTRLPKAITAPLSNKDHTIPSPMPASPYTNNGKSSGKNCMTKRRGRTRMFVLSTGFRRFSKNGLRRRATRTAAKYATNNKQQTTNNKQNCDHTAGLSNQLATSSQTWTKNPAAVWTISACVPQVIPNVVSPLPI